MLANRRFDYATYERCIDGTTGAFFALPIEGTALLAGHSEAGARELGGCFRRLGILYQIQDDLVDLYGQKGRELPGGDLRAGKVSALVVEHLQMCTDDAPWLIELLERPREFTTETDVAFAAARFRGAGTLAACLDRIDALADAIANDENLVGFSSLTGSREQLSAPCIGTTQGFAGLLMIERFRREPAPAMVDAAAVATQASAMDVFEKNARSFWLASLFLPKAVAEDAAAVYSFCRYVDDLADDAVCQTTARAELSRLEGAIRSDDRAMPAVRTFLDTSERCDFPSTTGLALVEGVASDLGTVRVKDDDELYRYAYCVAGVVGEMMMGVLRVEDKTARPYAVALGLAMQLTNICRDVREDALLNRVYLPQTLLHKYGLATDDVLTLTATDESIRLVIDELLTMADALYERALQGMSFIPFRSRVGILIARRVYRSHRPKITASAWLQPVPRTHRGWHVGQSRAGVLSSAGYLSPDHVEMARFVTNSTGCSPDTDTCLASA